MVNLMKLTLTLPTCPVCVSVSAGVEDLGLSGEVESAPVNPNLVIEIGPRRKGLAFVNNFELNDILVLN